MYPAQDFNPRAEGTNLGYGQIEPPISYDIYATFVSFADEAVFSLDSVS